MSELPEGVTSVGKPIRASAARPYFVMGGKHSDLPRFAASLLGGELLDEAPAAKDASGWLYAYHRNAWQPDGEEFYRRAVRMRMGDQWLPKHASEVVQWIEDGAARLDPTPPLDRIRVLNGILRIDGDSVTLEPHNPDPLTPVQLPVKFDPTARCPHFKRFIREALPSSDLRLTAQEVMGYVLVPDNTQQKAILAYGEGGNGKSTWVRVVNALLGEENSSAHPLHALGDTRFASADLYGKLANIYADLSSQELSSSATFRAITGGDPIQAEHKNKNSFKFTPYARLIFSTNRYPPIANPTNALFDRWIVLPFDKRFRGTARENKKLVQMLIRPDELSGILNYALVGLIRLREQGHFTISRESEAALTEFRLAADTVASFLREEMNEPGFHVTSDVYRAFEGWCIETNHQTMSRNAFYARVREHWGREKRVHGRDGWRVT